MKELCIKLFAMIFCVLLSLSIVMIFDKGPEANADETQAVIPIPPPKSKLELCQEHKDEGLALIKRFEERGDIEVTLESAQEDVAIINKAVGLLQLANRCPEMNVEQDWRDAIRTKEKMDNIERFLRALIESRKRQ